MPNDGPDSFGVPGPSMPRNPQRKSESTLKAASDSFDEPTGDSTDLGDEYMNIDGEEFDYLATEEDDEDEGTSEGSDGEEDDDEANDEEDD